MIFFDLETTGLNPEKDRICQFHAIRISAGNGNGFEKDELTFLCDPEMAVEKKAQDTHGFSRKLLQKYPPFEARADEVQALFAPDEIIVGYNSRTFDTIMLHHELVRVGRQGLLCDPSTDDIVQPEIDLLKVWRTLEPRNLKGAAQRFGVDIPDEDKLHDARADTSLLPAILTNMRALFGASPNQLAALTEADEVDRAGKFKHDENGRIVFAFGKHRDGLAFDQPGYLRWMLKGDFPYSTKEIARRILREKGLLA